MLMRIAKSGANIGNGLGGFSPHVRRQLARRFLDSFREQNADHSLPVKVSSLPALRDDAISAKAESSAAVGDDFHVFQRFQFANACFDDGTAKAFDAKRIQLVTAKECQNGGGWHPLI